MAKIMKKAPAKKQPTQAEVIATIAAAAAAKIVTDVVTANNKSITAMLGRQTASIAELAAAQTTLTKHVATLTTAAEGEGDVDEIEATEEGEVEAEGDEDMAAAKKDAADTSDEEDDADADDEMEGAEDDAGDLDQLEEAEGVEKQGHQNEDAANKGSKTTVEDKQGPHVSAAAFDALKKQVATLTLELQASKKVAKKLEGKLAQQATQLTAAADRTARRSLPPEAMGLLAKAHINASDLIATGQKLSVAELDAVISSFNSEQGNRLTVTDRMMLKNQFTAAGLLDDGAVRRATN